MPSGNLRMQSTGSYSRSLEIEGAEVVSCDVSSKGFSWNAGNALLRACATQRHWV